MSNVPDDWDCYWRTCDRCGSRYHASEGGCGCIEEEEERERDELFERLKHATIDEIVREPVEHITVYCQWTGAKIAIGETEVRLHITEHDGIDEIVLTEKGFADLSRYLELGKEPTV